MAYISHYHLNISFQDIAYYFDQNADSVSRAMHKFLGCKASQNLIEHIVRQLRKKCIEKNATMKRVKI